MESKKNKSKFSRLCLSQNPSTAIGSKSPSGINTNNSQISKFFTRSQPTDECISKPILNDSNKHLVLKKQKDSTEIADTAKKIESGIDKVSDFNSKIIKQTDPKVVLMKFVYEPKTKKRTVNKISEKVDMQCSIKKFLDNDDNNSLLDFEIPRKMPKKSAPTIKVAAKTKTIKARKQQPDIRKVLKKQNGQPDKIVEKLLIQHSNIEQIDVDEMQLALALSKSLSSDVNTQMESEEDPFISDATKKTIQQFGFKSNRKENGFVALYGVPSSGSRCKWKSRYTQLTRRKEDVQKKKLQEEVEQLLLDNIMVESHASQSMATDETMVLPYEITSTLLQRYFVPEALLFTINSTEYSPENLRDYYTNNLFELSTNKAGVLLKDWSTIPGRDSVFDCMPNMYREVETYVETEQNTPKEQSENEVAESSQPHTLVTIRDKCSQKDDVVDILAESPLSAATISTSKMMPNENDPPLEKKQESIEDPDQTVLLDKLEVQYKLDIINTQMRMSQSFENVSSQNDINREEDKNWRDQLHRSQSPDLFDDFEMDELVDEAEIENSEDTENVCQPAESQGVIEICSTEPECDTVCEKGSDSEPEEQSGLIFSTQSSLQNGSKDSTVIEISDDSSSENLGQGDAVVVSPEYMDFDTNAISSENQGINESNTVDLPKQLSFTERLQQYENDIFNLENYDRKVSIDSNLSIATSEKLPDEKRGKEICMLLNDEPFKPVGSINFGVMSEEEVLLNQSICDIFEKSFNYHSVMQDFSPEKNTGRKFQKINSESTIQLQSIAPGNSFTGHKIYNEPIINTCLESNKYKFPAEKNGKEINLNDSNVIADLSNNEYIAKYEMVSIKPDFEHMETANIQAELKKYGLKTSLKRHQAIICLNYIFNRTHPFIEEDPVHLAEQLSKQNEQHKPLTSEEPSLGPNFNIGFSNDDLVNNLRSYKISDEIIVLPTWPRNKRPWCLQPLHIAWYNLVKANSEIDTYLLLKKPFHLKDLKNFFKTLDMNFDNKDLSNYLKNQGVAFHSTYKRNKSN